MNIPKFRLEFDKEQIEDYQNMVNQILTIDAPISNGFYVNQFEERFSVFMDTDYSVAVGCGTDALEVALRALDIKGKYVAIPTNTMAGTALAVNRAGKGIHWLDIELHSYGLNPSDLIDAFESPDCEIGAVIAVHIGGTVSEHIETIAEICHEYRVPLIEDAAQAAGAFRVGEYGDLTCYSFSATKPMTTGEGGMITTNDREYVSRMKSIRNFGSTGRHGEHSVVGGNFKMTEFQAALGLTELDRVGIRIHKRRKLSDVYHKRLDPRYFVTEMADGSHYKQIVEIPNMNRNHIKEHCFGEGVWLTGEVYPIPLHSQDLWKVEGVFENANFFCGYHICPPNYPELTEDDVHYVCDVLNDYEE